MTKKERKDLEQKIAYWKGRLEDCRRQGNGPGVEVCARTLADLKAQRVEQQ